MRHIGHDFLHAILHVDQSIFALLKSLALRPGRVAREYVEGRRKKYFGPFGFLIITVGLASFMTVATGVQWFAPATESGAADLLQRHINLVILLQMPWLAAACALLFRNPRLHYAEHLVLAAYTSGFRILFLALVATPAIYFGWIRPASMAFFPLYAGLWTAYFAFAAVQFYRGGAFWVAVRAAVAAVLGQAVTMALLTGFVVVFARMTGH